MCNDDISQISTQTAKIFECLVSLRCPKSGQESSQSVTKFQTFPRGGGGEATTYIPPQNTHILPLFRVDPPPSQTPRTSRNVRMHQQIIPWQQRLMHVKQLIVSGTNISIYDLKDGFFMVSKRLGGRCCHDSTMAFLRSSLLLNWWPSSYPVPDRQPP